MPAPAVSRRDRSRFWWPPLALWLGAMVAAAGVVAQSHFVADMSAFLPRSPTAQQQLLVDQITRGALSRTLLIGIEGATPQERARLSRELGQSLRASGRFDLVGNGEASDERAAGEIFLRYRYLVSGAVTADRFTVAGLHQAIGDSIDALSGSLGASLKDLLPRDPTGELLAIVGALDSAGRPRSTDGVWSSPDGQRAILLALSRADGADTDAQERLLQLIRQSFDAAQRADRIDGARLLVSGSAVFAVDARAAIRTQVTRLSLIGAAAMVGVLLLVFRSLRALALCLLPVVSGALLGTAAVSVLFGSVHGITIGFGSTLIGEAVDYSIYYLIQSPAARPTASAAGPVAAGSWLEDFWPTIRLGMLTSVCGYAALVFSGFPGLAQLGVFSIAGLVTAALVTRFVLPQFAAPAHAHFPRAPALRRIGQWRPAGRGPLLVIWACAALALAFLLVRHGAIWNPALSGLSPVAIEDQALDESLRADMGAPQMRYLVVVEAPDVQAALRGAEAVDTPLAQLQARKVIGGFDSPARIVPSQASQEQRRAALPGPAELERRLAEALQGLPLRVERLRPFLADVTVARSLPALTRADLGQTSLGLSFDALLLRGVHGITAFIPVREPAAGDAAGPRAPAPDGPAIGPALLAAAQAAQQRLREPADAQTRVQAIDMAEESARIYAQYFHEILVLSAGGLVGIALLLGFTLRSGRRAAAVLLPLGLAVLLVMAALVACGERLNLLHLVGLFLIVAVGSNYALFFNRSARRDAVHAAALGRPDDSASGAATLQSLLLANTLTVIGFGVLAFSSVPVLHALGVTVAPGAVLALWLSRAFAPVPQSA